MRATASRVPAALLARLEAHHRRVDADAGAHDGDERRDVTTDDEANMLLRCADGEIT